MGKVVPIGAADHARLAEFEHELADLRRSPHSSSVIRRITELLSTDFSVSWRFEREEDQVFLADVMRSSSFIPMAYFETLSAGLRSGEMGFLFSTRVPEAAQRNRPLIVDGATKGRGLSKQLMRRLGLSRAAYAAMFPKLASTIDLHERYGVANHYQLRTLICDGSLVIMYVNTIREGMFTARQQRLYKAAVELLRRRALLDHRLAANHGLKAVLDVTLDALGRAAYIIDARGTILHANRLGVEALDRSSDLQSTLRDPTARAASGFDTTPVEQIGTSRMFLVMKRNADLTEISAALATRLGLGERTRSVFMLAASGETTKNIATRLALAENTVEYHLTRLYRRLGIHSRIELHRLLLEHALQKNTP